MSEAILVAEDRTIVYKRAFELLSHNTQEYDEFVKFIENDIVHRLPAHKHLLDIGAGRGNLAKPISQHFEHTTIVEPNPHFFEEVMTWARDCERPMSGHNDIWDKVQLDIVADLIFISHVLYYVPLEDHLAFVNKAYDLLRPGGCMVLALNGKPSDIWKMSHLLYTPEQFMRLPYAELLFANLREWNFPATYHPFFSEIVVDTADDMRFLIEFLMLDKVAVEDAPTASIREAYREVF
jgi:SAM-dependent methyltransferase